MSYFKNMKDKCALPCSVSIDVVNYVATLMPEQLMSNGKPITPRVLFMLGFQVDINGGGYAVYEGVRIRDKDRPYLTYPSIIYNGKVRKEVLHVDEDGCIVFSKVKSHFMERVYIENEVLTLSGMDKTLMENISTIGNKKFYDDGMAALDKRVDPNKPIRNIVRP